MNIYGGGQSQYVGVKVGVFAREFQAATTLACASRHSAGLDYSCRHWALAKEFIGKL